MNVHPAPGAEATPITETNTVDLSSGQRAVISFTPERSSTRFRIATVATTKYAEAAYTVKADDSVVFGPSEVPPAPLEDVAVTWVPTIPAESELQVIVEDLRGTGSARPYTAQPIGYEERHT